MLALGLFEINRTHTVEVDAPLCVIEVTITDPRDGSVVPIRAGAKVRLVREDGSRTAFMGETDDDGYVMFTVTEALENVAVEIDFEGREFLDFDEQEFVSKDDVSGLDKRPLLRMPDVWRSDMQPEVFDALDGRFAKGRLPTIEVDGQGTEVTPWEIRLDHAWQPLNVAFEYYDTNAKDVVRLDRGPVIEAFEGSTFAPSTLVGATTLEDGDNLRLLRLFRKVAPASLCLRVRMPEGTFVDLTEHFGPDRVQEPNVDPSSLPMSTRLERYPLPSLWLSRGQFATTKSDPSKRTFEAAVAEVVGTDEALTFDLDDVLLVDDERAPIDIEDTLPVTVFGRDFAIKDPDSTEPQHSKHVISSSHLRGRDAYYDETTAADGTVQPYRVTRVIRRGRKFYHLDGSRTTSGALVGVRAAIRDAHPIVRKPAEKFDGTHDFRGEIHYFSDVGAVEIDDPSSEHRLGVALVFISVRIRKLRPTINEAELQKTRNALRNTAQRWTGQPLEDAFGQLVPLIPNVYRITSGHHATKFVFHFPSVEGKARINCFLHKPGKKSKKQYEEDKKSNPKTSKYRSFRAHAFLNHIALDVREDLEPEQEGSTGYEHPGNARDDVVAHELGHIMGLPDEYMEKIDINHLTIPRHKQYGRPAYFAFQTCSMMRGDITPMLRHYWHLSSLISGQPGIPQGKPSIYSDTREPENSGPTARVHRFSMPTEHPSPYTPFKSVEVGPEAMKYEAQLALFGDEFDADEVSRGATACLLISPKLSVKMRRVSAANPQSAFHGHARDKALRKFGASLPQRFDDERFALRLKSSDSQFVNTHLSRIHISFRPRFSRRKRLSSDVRIRLDRASTKSPPEVLTGDEFHITDQTPPVRVVRAVLGLDASTTKKPVIEVVAKGGGSVTFHVGGTSIDLGATSSKTVGKNKFRYAIHDEPGVIEELSLEAIASNMAEAINLDTNDFAEFMSASLWGTTITLKPRGGAIHLAANDSYVITNQFVETIEPADLEAIAHEVGTAVGATFEVIRVPKDE